MRKGGLSPIAKKNFVKAGICLRGLAPEPPKIFFSADPCAWFFLRVVFTFFCLKTT